jgi:hypothetical protein
MIPDGSGEVNKFDRKSVSYLTASRQAPYKVTVISEPACHAMVRSAAVSTLASVIGPLAPHGATHV